MPEHYIGTETAAWDMNEHHSHAVWMSAHCLNLALQGKGIACSQARGLCLCIAVPSDLQELGCVHGNTTGLSSSDWLMSL